MVYQNQKGCSFRVHRGVLQGSVLGPAVFSLSINNLPASLPSSVSCSLYADDLAIWPSSPSIPAAVEARQEALIRLEHWCLPLISRKCEASFSKFCHNANKLFLNAKQSTAAKYLLDLVTRIMSGTLNKNKPSRSDNYKITSDEKQILQYIGGYLVMRALKKFAMY